MSKNQNKLVELTGVELIKDRSNYLRGTIVEGLADETTGALGADDQTVIKFHGTYQQQDRDLDKERKRQKLEPLYSFLIRIRVPGGHATAQQWVGLDDIANELGDSTLKLTTRQAFELHGITKWVLKRTMQRINDVLMDSIAACGDVNRNVMCSANPHESPVHAEVLEHSKLVSAHLTPRTTAYQEIWLNNELQNAEPVQDHEPIYGKHYLPRKFKIAFGIPPRNDADLFANDLGFIAIVADGKLVGYNVAVGGGMGMTFGNGNTYPRLSNVIGYIPKEKVVEVAEKVVLIQRDNGNRTDRKISRFKYTVDRIGLEWIKLELNRQLGWDIEPARPFRFDSNGDRYGWYKGTNNKWYLSLFIEGGKLIDKENYPVKTALRKVAEQLKGGFLLTGNQNVVIEADSEADKELVDQILAQYGVKHAGDYTALRLNSIACVALPLCSLAFADAERYLPSLLDKLDVVIKRLGLQDDPILIRMTGCPNGCARPFLGEIGLVGRAPGRYNIYLGAGFDGNRLNKLYKEMATEAEILEILTSLFEDYAKNKLDGERFGDFTIRAGYVVATTEGKDFHQNIGEPKKINFQI